MTVLRKDLAPLCGGGSEYHFLVNAQQHHNYDRVNDEYQGHLSLINRYSFFKHCWVSDMNSGISLGTNSRNII